MIILKLFIIMIIILISLWLLGEFTDREIETIKSILLGRRASSDQ
jgi:hypothetical protein